MTQLHKRTDHYTYADYAAWPGDVRYELLAGEAEAMTPAPSTIHQALAFRLGGVVFEALRGSSGLAFAAPFDVLLDAPQQGREGAEYVVQPNLVVICDRSKIKPHGCEGAPELVVEIVSPSSSGRDYVQKLRAYERFGVAEYWIVDPGSECVNVFRVTAPGRLDLAETLTPTDTVISSAINGLSLELVQLFADLPG